MEKIMEYVVVRREINGTVFALLDEGRADLLRYAFEKASAAQKLNWRYLEGMYRRFELRDITTGVEAYQYDLIRSGGYKETACRDYLQLLAYMFRFDAKIGYYLYPETTRTDDFCFKLNKGLTYEKNVVPREDISVTKCGLKIPENAMSFEDFSTKIRVNEQKFIEKIIG